jgi:hypothetical protein
MINVLVEHLPPLQGEGWGEVIFQTWDHIFQNRMCIKSSTSRGGREGSFSGRLRFLDFNWYDCAQSLTFKQTWRNATSAMCE